MSATAFGVPRKASSVKQLLALELKAVLRQSSMRRRQTKAVSLAMGYQMVAAPLQQYMVSFWKEIAVMPMKRERERERERESEREV